MLGRIKTLYQQASLKLHEDTSEVFFRIGLSAIAAARGNYKNITRLEQADLKVFSQHGEDGIIDFIIDRLGILKPTFVEIGTEDYSESNTRFLFQRTNTKGLIIDCDAALKEKSKKTLGHYYWKGEITALSAFVTKGNIAALLSQGNKKWIDCDIFSLDIDGNDYWIMQEVLPLCRNKIIILEYNPYFGGLARVSVPYREDFCRTDFHYSNLCFGASLNALASLMSEYNYTFAGTNLNNNNGFWVRSDIFHLLGIEPPSVTDLSVYAQNYTRESRNEEGQLNFLAGEDRLRAIKDRKLVNLDKHNALESVSDIFSL